MKTCNLLQTVTRMCLLFRGDAFLEPYMQGLGTDFTHSSSLTTTLIKEHSVDIEDIHNRSITSSPATLDAVNAPPRNDNEPLGLAADISAQFRIINLASSRNSLNQVSSLLIFTLWLIGVCSYSVQTRLVILMYNCQIFTSPFMYNETILFLIN